MDDFQFLPFISTALIIASALLMAIGWIFIKQKKRVRHEQMMTAAAWCAVLFFAVYIGRSVLFGNTAFGGPEHLKVYYTLFLLFHIILSTVGGVLGGYTLWLGKKKRLGRHRKLGPVSCIIWFLTALTGVVVYVLLYIMYPGGETTSLLRAIFSR